MRADLFCRVIDNYGDIGVCWRLARQLVHGHDWKIRLWVDNLASFARIEPTIRPALDRQQTLNIDIVSWTQLAPDLTPGDAVIEAFACNPPPRFVARMVPGRQAWINLEYLSAEPWVASCHGLPSPQSGGLVKHFFFPGFTPATGGLLREPGLLAERDAWRADPTARQALLARLGLPDHALTALHRGARLCTLFCYPNAPVDALLRGLASSSCAAVLLVPHGVAPALTDGAYGQTYVVRTPFVSQTDFDRLLWSADFNLVRGEDSFVRALWAGRPMLWHIYAQDDAAHLVKLDAWLRHYDAPAPITTLMRAWNGATASNALEASLAAAFTPNIWQDWTERADAWSRQLACQPDLADSLADFCTRIVTASRQR